MLNASQSQRTQSSCFPTELFGSGVQHIAFATDDLLATVARLEQNGVRLHSLRPRGQREYLQVYTETYDQRFFFEIIQRRGYRGYGAANAPVRLAAPARLSADGNALDV